MIKYTPQILKKIEEIFEENAYTIRYEKGNFKSGFCIIEDRKMIIVNRFAAPESRFNTLLEILKIISKTVELQGEKFLQFKKLLEKQQIEESAG
jgi:hypothetical protein